MRIAKISGFEYYDEWNNKHIILPGSVITLATEKNGVHEELHGRLTEVGNDYIMMDCSIPFYSEVRRISFSHIVSVKVENE